MEAIIQRAYTSLFSGSVHDIMEAPAETVQTPRKKRTQEAKVGRIKYTLQLIKEMRRDIEEVKLMQRTICAGLKGLFNFQKPMIQRIACGDEVDVEILEILHEAGSRGVLPKDVSFKLGGYNVRRHQVTRRIQRMNRRMMKEIGERLVEKRGWHWALTGFGFEVWGQEEGLAKKIEDALEEKET
jgi:hypothetical protein